MWRNNALRLRKTSSLATSHSYGLKLTIRHGSSSSLPIAEDEFLGALRKVLDARWDPQSKTPLGFAISGGVDSMALAALYARARKSDSNLPPAHGFIVDHKARPESTGEAHWVVEQLRQKLDMDSTVLPLTWPGNFDYSDLRRFETEARRRRYQALGLNCKERNITALLVAHHVDDQAETVLMRLSNNRLRSGLQAMKSVEWIPECEGLHGVYHSGKPISFHKGHSAVEQGGMQILRPLLGFEKARLIATCEEANISWAEDKTNKVQTLTARNAIRHIVQNHKLPEALSVRNLVDVSAHMQNRIEAHKAHAAKLFDQCLIELNIQTASAHVRFPPYESLLDRDEKSIFVPTETDSHRNEARNTAYYLIKRVGELVSPQPSATLETLAATITHIYPELAVGVTSPASKSYCAFGVWWRASEIESPFPSAPHAKDWFLMRQPPPIGDTRIELPKLEIEPGTPVQNEAYNLCDGRFWIKLRNLSRGTLILRLFTDSDRHRYQSAEGNKQAKNGGLASHHWITAALAHIKPSTLHYTLPAVFLREDQAKKEKLVGFPTLNVSVEGFGAPEDTCTWSVRYKKIDFGAHDPETMAVRFTQENSRQVSSAKNAKKNLKKALGRAPRLKASEKREIFKTSEMLRKLAGDPGIEQNVE